MKNIPLFQDAPDFLQQYTYKLPEMEGIELPQQMPVDLSEGSRTPITHQEIPLVHRDAWDSMSEVALNEQLLILEKRYLDILSMSRPDVAAQMVEGITALKRKIAQKVKTSSEEAFRRRIPGDHNEST